MITKVDLDISISFMHFMTETIFKILIKNLATLRARYLIIESLCLGRSKTLSYVGKKLKAFLLGNTYLHQTFTEYVSNQFVYYTFIMRPDVTASYGKFINFIAFFEYFYTLLLTIYI